MVLCDEKMNMSTIRNLCKLRLLGYSESLKELAECFQEEYVNEDTDRETAFEQYKMWENRQVIRSNFDELSRMMARLAKDLYSYLPMEEKQFKSISYLLRGESVYLSGACYLAEAHTNRAMALTLHTTKKEGVLSEKVADMLSAILNKKMKVSVNSPYRIGRQQTILMFVEEPKYVALTGFARAKKESEEVSGDNYSILESERGKLSMILSDGTGSGEEAFKESGRVLDMLERMIETGYGEERALGLLNAAMCVGENGISHPTLDYCSLDLYSGDCSFYKVGGVTSFIKRQEKIEVCNGGNLPLGVFQNVEYLYQSFHLEDGDYVIMMTDGILDAFSQEAYEIVIENFLSNIRSLNPEEIANLILQKAIYESKGHIRDDMTVLVAGIFT